MVLMFLPDVNNVGFVLFILAGVNPGPGLCCLSHNIQACCNTTLHQALEHARQGLLQEPTWPGTKSLGSSQCSEHHDDRTWVCLIWERSTTCHRDMRPNALNHCHNLILKETYNLWRVNCCHDGIPLIQGPGLWWTQTFFFTIYLSWFPPICFGLQQPTTAIEDKDWQQRS